MTEDAREEAIRIGVPILLFIVFSVVTLFVLGPNCSLLSNDRGPFNCHTIPLADYCCTDQSCILYARFIFIFGLGLTAGSALYLNRNTRKSQT